MRDTHHMKKGDSLQDLIVRCYDRDGLPMDLTNASEVRIIMREAGGTVNEFEGLCEIEAPRTGEAYPSRVRGPNHVIDDAGAFWSYFRAQYPTKQKRVPSKGYLTVEVERGFE